MIKSFLIEPKVNYIELDLNALYDLNSYIKVMSSKAGRYEGTKMKRDSTNYVSTQVELQWLERHFDFQWPSGLLFNWHVNHKRDPDNISSAGRKAILDGFQKAILGENKFLPNDNSKYINGFIDQFTYDSQNVVTIYPFNQEQLNLFLIK